MADTKAVKRKLFDKLKKYHNDKDFVCGVVSNTQNDEDRQTIINYIDNSEDVTIENIILLSLHLKNERNRK